MEDEERLIIAPNLNKVERKLAAGKKPSRVDLMTAVLETQGMMEVLMNDLRIVATKQMEQAMMSEALKANLVVLWEIVKEKNNVADEEYDAKLNEYRERRNEAVKKMQEAAQKEQEGGENSESESSESSEPADNTDRPDLDPAEGS